MARQPRDLGAESEHGQRVQPAAARPVDGESLHGRAAGGVSGDSSCADHNIAWRTRNNLNLDYVPGGVSGDGDRPDNIVYDIKTHPFQMNGVSGAGWGQPHCVNAGVENAIAATLPPVR